MLTVKVDLDRFSYPIHIGRGLLASAQLLSEHIVGQKVAIVTNTTVAPLYLDKLTSALQGYQVTPVILPDGEQ